jgi:hypothetical protein
MAPQYPQVPQQAELAAPAADDLEVYRRVRGFLDRFAYKPGWRFAVTPPPSFWERGLLQVTLWTLNARHDPPGEGHPVELRGEFHLPDLQALDLDGVDGARYLPDWLLEIILGMEDHEAREWFRVDGQLPYDPHRPDPLRPDPLLADVPTATAETPQERWRRVWAGTPQARCPTCGGRGWHTAGGGDPVGCGSCPAGAAWEGQLP